MKRAKRPRTPTWDYISATATNPKGMNGRDRIRFQAFNPNGLMAQAKAIEARVEALAEQGTVPYGWVIAYNFDYYWKQTWSLVDKKQPRWRSIRVFEETLSARIAQFDKKVTEKEESK